MNKNQVTMVTRSEEETKELGRRIGRKASDGLFLALTGDLGAGKTHFVQGLAEGMGIPGVVVSPTFTIMNYYDGTLPLKHFDFYRLESEEELYNIGWDEYSAGGVTVAEWAELFPSLIPEEALTVVLKTVSEFVRQIEIAWTESAPPEVIKEITQYAACH